MDTNIKLRHKATEQECAFDDESAVTDFLANVEKPSDWAVPGTFAAKVVDVNLPELHAQLDASAAAEDTAAEQARAELKAMPIDQVAAMVQGAAPAPKPAAKRAKK
jgi:hypothetical protein